MKSAYIVLQIAFFIMLGGDIATTLAAFMKGYGELTRGYRKLPRWGVVALRIGLTVACYFSARYVWEVYGPDSEYRHYWATQGLPEEHYGQIALVILVAGIAGGFMGFHNNKWFYYFTAPRKADRDNALNRDRTE